MSRWGSLIEIGSDLSATILRELVPPHRVGVVGDDTASVIDVWELSATALLAVVEQSGEHFVIPAVTDGTLRRARVGDCFLNNVTRGSSGRFVSSVELADAVTRETRVEVDQTNESFILNDQFVVKWQLTLGRSHALGKERCLAAAGFPHTPRSFGDITWRGESGDELLVASVQQFLPGSSDGWTWCVGHAMADDRSGWVERIASVVADMHTVLSDHNLAHGDLHVGQLLLSGDDYFVIDFDGHPLGAEHESWIGDVVSMLCSFIHVGAVAQVKYGSPHDTPSWIAEISHRFLEHYQHCRPDVALPSESELWALMAQAEKREYEYAAKFLPEWLYAAEYGIDYVDRRVNEGS